jgi:hypothetical protein
MYDDSSNNERKSSSLVRWAVKLSALILVVWGVSRCLCPKADVEKESSAPQVIHTGVADPSVLNSYMRTGVAERIMTTERRGLLGDCYQNHLMEAPKNPGSSKEEGKIIVLFEVAENGSILSSEVIDNELKSQNLQNCVMGSLSGVRFLPPPLGINRYIAYDFNFKQEETLAREMEELKSAPTIELIPSEELTQE